MNCLHPSRANGTTGGVSMKLVRNTLLAAILFLILFPAAGHAAALLVRWNANTESDIAGYKVYYGTKSRTYGTPVTAGNVTSYQLTGVTPGTTYYIGSPPMTPRATSPGSPRKQALMSRSPTPRRQRARSPSIPETPPPRPGWSTSPFPQWMRRTRSWA